MPLTGTFAEDEATMREALIDKAKAVVTVAPFDFPEDHLHTRRRYVRDNQKWEALALIPDPDDPSQKTMRLLSVETASGDISKTDWRMVFDVKVGMGFVDERPENRGNSYDALMKVVYTLLQQFVEDSTLGIDPNFEVTRVRHLGTRFVPSDVQAKPAHVADLQVHATLELC